MSGLKAGQGRVKPVLFGGACPKGVNKENQNQMKGEIAVERFA